MRKKQGLKVDANEDASGRTVVVTFSEDEDNISFRPVLRNPAEVAKNEQRLSELFISVTGCGAWHIEKHASLYLGLEQVEAFLLALTEARDIMKKHEEVCHEKIKGIS